MLPPKDRVAAATERKRKQRQARRVKGLCEYASCKNPRAPNRAKCYEHLQDAKIKTLLWTLRREQESEETDE